MELLQPTLIQGDSYTYMKSMPDNSVDLIVTDPPYDIGATNGGGTINKIKKLNSSLKDLYAEQDLTRGYDIKKYGDEFMRIMKEPNIYLWCNKTQIPQYFEYYVGKHKCKFDILTWHKTNALPTYSNKYLSDTEYCLYFRKGKGKCFPQSYEDAKTYNVMPINHKDKKNIEHPTVKPLQIEEAHIRNSSKEGQVVFDPFMGSGTTGIASIKNGRNSIGVEISRKWYNLSQSQIYNYEYESDNPQRFVEEN